MINYIVLFVALVISGVAAYYSVIGLTTIFAAAFWPVVVMGTSIEAAKVVGTSWLQLNWKTAPVIIKWYLVCAIVVLSLITSLGTFGFLSKAHTDLTTTAGVTTVQLDTINQQIAIEKQRLATLLDQASKYNGPMRRFEKDIQQTQDKIVQLTNDKLPLLQEENKLNAEVGPLKYVAELVYGKTDEHTLGSAVRFVIVLIVLVFDPLALALLLAASHGMRSKEDDEKIQEHWTSKLKELKSTRKKGTIEINESSVHKM